MGHPGIIPIILLNMLEASSDVSFWQFFSVDDLLLIQQQR